MSEQFMMTCDKLAISVYREFYKNYLFVQASQAVIRSTTVFSLVAACSLLPVPTGFYGIEVDRPQWHHHYRDLIRFAIFASVKASIDRHILEFTLSHPLQCFHGLPTHAPDRSLHAILRHKTDYVNWNLLIVMISLPVKS